MKRGQSQGLQVSPDVGSTDLDDIWHQTQQGLEEEVLYTPGMRGSGFSPAPVCSGDSAEAEFSGGLSCLHRRLSFLENPLWTRKDHGNLAKVRTVIHL